MGVENFSDKLQLILKALVLSRAGLASQLNVDKSLVGRWAAGTVRPSEHNLAKITRFVGERVPGFTLLDWDRDINDLKSRLGIHQDTSMSSPSPAIMEQMLPLPVIESIRSDMQKRGKAYEGLWRGTRPSNDLPGRFVHDICLTEQRPDGILRFRVGVEGVRYDGFSLLLQHQLFSVAWDTDTSAMIFSIINGVARQRPEILDGINLSTLRDAGGSPCASSCILERIGELSGDPVKDEEMYERAVADLNPLAPEGSISDDLARHLTENVSDGPPGIYRMLFGLSIARGSLLSE